MSDARYEVRTVFNDGAEDVRIIMANSYEATHVHEGTGVRVQHIKFLGRVDKP